MPEVQIIQILTLKNYSFFFGKSRIIGNVLVNKVQPGTIENFLAFPVKLEV